MSYRYYWLLGRNSQSSLSRTGSEKGRRDFQSPNLFWDAICLVSLTRAICLEWLLPGILYQGQACLNFSSGLLEICKAVVLHLALAKEWKVFTLLQMCLSALLEASSLTLIFLLPIARKTLPSLCFKERLCQHPWKAREAAASCWFMGHPTGGLEEQLPALHWLMLYPTGISTASVTSPAVMGREQQQWYPLQSDLWWLNPILFNLKILSVVLLSIQRLQEPKMAYH